MTTTTQNSATQLDWADENGTVTVTPRNQDRYNITVRKAIELLRISQDEARFDSEFRVLLQRCGEWLKRNDCVRAAYMTSRDGGLLFVVVRCDSSYDEDFEDSLSALDIEIANDGDLSRIRLDVLSVPDASPEALETFIDPSFVIEYTPPGSHADRVRPHSARESQ